MLLQLLWTRRDGLVLLMALGVAPAAAAPLHRIIAVGDLHGDFSAWRQIARAAALVDEGGSWTGGATVLVQTGDAVDRGPDSRKLVLELMRLQREAARAGGRVVALVGNHEAMNMTGDLRYVSAADYAAYRDRNSERVREQTFEANQAQLSAAYRNHDPAMTDEAIRQAWFDATPLGSLEHRVAWAPTGEIGHWVASNPAVALIDGTIFVHGGISPAYAAMTIEEINAQVGAALLAQTADPKAIINDPLGPLWYRGLATPDADAAAAGTPEAAASTAPPEPPVEEQLAFLFSAWNARRIVIAHTPLLSGIAILQQGRLIRIDTGITDVFGGQVSWLEILDGKPLAHAVPRSPSILQQGARK